MPDPNVQGTIAVVGPEEVYGGFRALGVIVRDAHTGAEAERALDELASGGAAVIFLAEPLYQERPQLLERFRREFPPIISVLPDHRGGTGATREHVRRLIERAVGVDILSRGG